MQMTAKQTFNALAEQIKNAVAERAFYSVCHQAAALGLVGEKIDLKFSIRYHFEHTDSTGNRLILHAYSYDPSGPTETRVGITRFTLTLAESGGTDLHYENHFDGLVKTSCVDGVTT